jgi:hypothetical protein
MNTKAARDRRAACLNGLKAALPQNPPTRQPPGQLHTPNNLPDPWLMDSEALIRELDRSRELANRIPIQNIETHFAVNSVVDALWNLRENVRFLLALHREGQRRFAQRAKQLAIETASQSRNAASRHGGRALGRGVA